MDLVLRDCVEPADVDAIKDILESTGFFFPDEVAVGQELASEHLAKGEASGYLFLFTLRDGRPAAYTCYGPIPGTDGRFDIYWIAVKSELRGQGLGRRLLAETEARIRSLGARLVYAETSGREQYAPTRAFYERAGYKVAAVLPEFYRDGEDKVIYVKDLAARPGETERS
jgi:ribosomal protein S18 acetylase RimI-like enzyme